MTIKQQQGVLGLSAAAVADAPLLGYRLDGADAPTATLVRARQPWIDTLSDGQIAIDVREFASRQHLPGWLLNDGTRFDTGQAICSGLSHLEARWGMPDDVKQLGASSSGQARSAFGGGIEILVWPNGLVIGTLEPRLTLLGLLSANFSDAAYEQYAHADPEGLAAAVELIPTTLKSRYVPNATQLLSRARQDHETDMHDRVAENQRMLKQCAPHFKLTKGKSRSDKASPRRSRRATDPRPHDAADDV